MKHQFILVFLFCTFHLFSQKIEKIAPPFWYKDMQNSELQILCYGKNIAQYDVSLSKGKLIQLRKTENPNYLFILMDTKGLKTGFFNINFLKNNKITQSKLYELKTRRENSRYRNRFDSSDVIYLLMPDRFANGNPKNDSTENTIEKVDRKSKGGRHGGDIQGLIDHIALANGVNNIHTLGYFAKDCVFSVQMRLR